MKIPFKIAGTQYYCPTSWQDVTTKQWQELKSCNVKDDLKIISILLGVPYDIVFNLQQFDFDDKIKPHLMFLSLSFAGVDALPVSKIKIKDSWYDIPKDLKQFSLGQKIDARNTMNDSVETKKDLYACVSEIVAIYLQPIVDPVPISERQFKTDEFGYDAKRAEKFAREVVDNCSIVETYPIASFFLSKLMQSKQKKTLPYPLNLIRNKWLRGYLNWTYSKKSTRLMPSLTEIS